MSRIHNLKRAYFIYMLNTFFCGTHFFKIKQALLKFAGVSCGKNVRVVGPIYVGNISRIYFGDNVWVGKGFSVFGNGEVIIGNNIDIAPEVAFVTGSHEIGYDIRRAGKGISYKIKVEDGCWIGTRATIFGNTVIGRGCVVAAGAVVNRTIGPNIICGGIPAKEIKEMDALLHI